MARRILAVVLLLLAFALSADSTRPVIKVKQLPRSEFDVEQRGAVSIAYEMTIHNPSQQAVTLRSLTMKTVGRSPYTLKDEAVQLNERIEAGSATTVTFSMWAHSRSRGRAGRATVWVRGSARFEGDGPTFVTKFSDSFREPD